MNDCYESILHYKNCKYETELKERLIHDCLKLLMVYTNEKIKTESVLKLLKLEHDYKKKIKCGGD